MLKLVGLYINKRPFRLCWQIFTGHRVEVTLFDPNVFERIEEIKINNIGYVSKKWLQYVDADHDGDNNVLYIEMIESIYSSRIIIKGNEYIPKMYKMNGTSEIINFFLFIARKNIIIIFEYTASSNILAFKIFGINLI